MVTAVKDVPGSKTCPHCGHTFRALHAHLPHCRERRALRAPSQAAPPPGSLLPEALLAAQYQDVTKITRESISSLTGERSEAALVSTVEHTTADKVMMYKPYRDSKGAIRSYRRVKIKTTNIGQAVKDGFRVTCGLCGAAHGNEPNDCLVGPRTKYTVCPICGARVFDSRPETVVQPQADENAVQFEEYSTTTPEQRIRANVKTHIGAWHPQEGLAYGVEPLIDKRLPKVGENLPR